MNWRSHDLAPSHGQTLCALEELTDGSPKKICFGEGAYALSFLVHRSGAKVKAYVNRCPHFSVPLDARPGHFVMLEGERVMCAFHGAVFRLEDGYCEAGPAATSFLEPVQVVVCNGMVCIADEGGS